jgi:DEAD/DEAH box helicase domain-containing protein
LNGYFRRLRIDCDLWSKKRIDLLEEIELATRERISLSRLAEANLGKKKEQHGIEAIQLYKEGRMDELKKYCLNDVRLTKELYDLYVKQRYLMVPSKQTGETVKVEFAKL